MTYHRESIPGQESGFDFDPRFKKFHELMGKKIREILLVSTPYDAWIMEEDCRLSERIIHEYRGLNLSHPPRLHWVSTDSDALSAVEKQRFDMVVIISHYTDSDTASIGPEIQAKDSELPIIYLNHDVTDTLECVPNENDALDNVRTFLWTGNTDILLAIVKSVEDEMNVSHDTYTAGIRVIIFVEDSTEYISSLLPILYRELVIQTQAVMEEGLNEEHRLLAMRARPKILVANDYESAKDLYNLYKPYVLGIISDVRFPRECELDGNAGFRLLEEIKRDRFDIPLLLTSSESANAVKAQAIPATFVDKNSDSLHADVRSFFINHLGFGDFVFRSPDGPEIARAPNLQSLEKKLQEISEESFMYHCNRNDFSRWLFARSEIELASIVRPIRDEDFKDVESHRHYLVSIIHQRRISRQKGVVVNLDGKAFDHDTDFFKIGTGSLGGKGRGLAFISAYLRDNSGLHDQYDKISIRIPQTMVITTEGFDLFIRENDIDPASMFTLSDQEIADKFLKSSIPDQLENELRDYLNKINYPLAIRSSSLLEDAQFKAYAGLYKTYMLSNDDDDLECRLDQLTDAIKLVYASTYYKAPRDFAKRVGHRTEEEKMAVIVQKMVGDRFEDYFYPAMSGVAQSHNYYPFSKMKPEEGIATVALGLGKTVMEGQKALRFSPKYPEILPQRTSVDDILDNAQRFVYVLKLGMPCTNLDVDDDSTLEKFEISELHGHFPVMSLCSTYIPSEHRIRHTTQANGHLVLTFASVLKYGLFPLGEVLSSVLDLGQKGMGCPVEIEFSVKLYPDRQKKPEFYILQVRPMTVKAELKKVNISKEDINRTFCYSNHALGNTYNTDIKDIVYVKPDVFDPGRTPEVAQEIGKMNAELMRNGHQFLLVGPGRWGSADRWLGIPVSWSDISGVGAMVETSHANLKADPSQGSHFFHNITTLGINYINVLESKGDFFNWEWLTALPIHSELNFIAHVNLDHFMEIKVDGRESRCVMIYN